MKQKLFFLSIILLIFLYRDSLTSIFKSFFDNKTIVSKETDKKLLNIDTNSKSINIEGIELIKIPAGVFKMGSPESILSFSDDEKPLHGVKISKAFFMGKYEITQSQYRKITGTNSSRFRGPNLPVEQVNWHSVQDFITRLNRKIGCKITNTLELMDQQGLNAVPSGCFRLPTEAEWEYAAQAGSNSLYSIGNKLNSNQANFDGRHPFNGAKKTMYRERTIDVGSFRANNFGLYDMHGNVSEWCQDWYSKNFYKKSSFTDPLNRSKTLSRSYRGGSWNLQGKSQRSAKRYSLSPIIHSITIGFRLVFTV
ncbi:MAG: formylglycine-generating enzyme family protein [Candidatus Cloacimonetes bacterium]|nr:formylglycine-generating enzyme family protein [Candidatus Cloacimonadota bacterium]